MELSTYFQSFGLSGHEMATFYVTWRDKQNGVFGIAGTKFFKLHIVNGANPDSIIQV